MSASATNTLDSTATPSSEEKNGSLTQLGPYVIDSLVGKGPTGPVFTAMHDKLKKRVAIKLLPSFKNHDSSRIAEFTREMAAAGQIKHPNIVSVTDAGSHKGMHFIAMEYLEGIDVEQIVARDQKLPVGIACEIIRQTAIGLQHLHENGLIHRDVNPSNLILTKKGIVKLLGLGVGELRDAGISMANSTESVSKSGFYLAPEQFSPDTPVDPRADIFGLGSTLYRLIGGEPPFSGEATWQTAGDAEPKPLKKIAKDVSPDLSAIVQRMMAKDPAKRFQNPSEVVALMCNWASGENIPHIVSRHMNPLPQDSAAPAQAEQKQPTANETPAQPQPAQQTAAEQETANAQQAKSQQANGTESKSSSVGLGAILAVGTLAILGVVGYVAFAMQDSPLKKFSPIKLTQTSASTDQQMAGQNDYYHNKLLHQLRSEFGLTGGKWVLTPNEVSYINQAVCYGHTISQSTTTGQDFTQVVQMDVDGEGDAPWDAGYFIPDVASVKQGDRVLLVLWMRTSERSKSADGKVSIFVEDVSNNAKEVYLTVNPTDEWQQYLIPFQASSTPERRIGFHLAFQRQTLECGGLTMINYGKDVPFSSLPYRLNSE